MEILLIGGFLGGGKTTIINKLLHGMDDQGLKVAIIENEIGTTGIDDVTLGGSGVSVTPLFGGCVCCQISGDLLTSVNSIQQTIDPDWVVVELTGLALLDSIRDTFSQFSKGGIRTHCVVVADSSRWAVLMKACEPIIQGQLKGADLVLLNKCDLKPPTPETLASITELTGGAPILQVAAPREENLWTTLQNAMTEEAQ